MSAVPSIVITTRLPPQICGIGAYSWLAHKHGSGDPSRVEFLVMDGASESRSALDWPAIIEFNGDAARLLEELCRAGAARVLLHYAGRGYHRFGCPLWLPRVLNLWKARFPGGHLSIFFHEVPGKAPRRLHHFILAKISEQITRRLARAADVVITNTEGHAAILHELADGAEVHCLPVGSNIEPDGEIPRARAETEFVLFGLPFGREQTLQSFGGDIKKWHETGLLTKLHVIGPDDPGHGVVKSRPFAEGESGQVIRHGALPGAGVSLLLGSARFALTNVTRETWSKSGSFMACAAHGCAVVVEQRESGAPLCYAIAKDEVGRVAVEEIRARAAALKDWYENYAAWRVTAKRLSALSRSAGAQS